MNIDHFLRLSRPKKRVISILIDSFFITFSFALAFWARTGNFIPIYEKQYIIIFLGTLLATIYTFVRLGLYRAVLRYLTFHTLAVVALGTAVSAAIFGLLSFYVDAFVPRSVPVIYGTFLCILCGSSRIIIRELVCEVLSKNKKRVIIYGAGSAGRQLAQAVHSSGSYKVEAFIDDNNKLERTVIMGISVFGVNALTDLVSKRNVTQVLLAIPSATRSKRKAIINSLIDLRAEVLTVPSLHEIVAGHAKIDELKDVAIEDLLGRDPIEPVHNLLEANIKDKTVLVTGAGGSIGAELCRQIVNVEPQKILLFDLSEYSLYILEKEIESICHRLDITIEVIPLIGSVCDIERVMSIMKAFDVQTVYHAAAYKHVPLVEYNVIEGVRNNVFGTYHCAKAAIAANVESFVLISTDKAVRPTNIMGASKRMAELALQALADETDKSHHTRFCMVRFGNVLGSSGSVIPLFKRQIAEGNAVTVTHPDIIRYFMTIPEAAQLVIQAGAMAKGGDVFVLDMGEPVKIVDLAEKLIRLSGLEVKSEDNPNGDIEIQYTGLRPGEKLYEELLIGDNVSGTGHERIMAAHETYLSLNLFEQILTELDTACQAFDYPTIQCILQDAPTQFTRKHELGDLVWQASQTVSRENVIHLGTKK